MSARTKLEPGRRSSAAGPERNILQLLRVGASSRVRDAAAGRAGRGDAEAGKTYEADAEVKFG